GVGGVVERLAVLELDEEANGIAALRAVGKLRAVEGERELAVAEGKLVPAAVLHPMSLDLLFAEPLADLEVADDGRTAALGDGNGIADMIAVAVRDENEIRRKLIGLRRRLGVAGEERVKQELLPVALDPQARVSQPAQASCHVVIYPVPSRDSL